MKTKPIKADLTDIIFEGPFRAYGAYQLRKLYNQRLAIATFIGLGLFFAGIGAPNLIPGKKRLNHGVGGASALLDTVVVSFTNQKTDLLGPQSPEHGIFICGGLEYFEELPVYSFKMPNPKKMDKMKGEKRAELRGKGAHIGVDTPGIDSFPMITYTEPEPVNLDSIIELIGYPKIALENGIRGKVIVRIHQDTAGKVLRWKIVKSAHPILSKAVEKYIGKIRFTPLSPSAPPFLFYSNIPFQFWVAK